MAIKIKIFDKPEPDETPELVLNTQVMLDGEYLVFACDNKGEPLAGGQLWSLLADGRQHCWSGISGSLGLALTPRARLRTGG